MPKSSTRRAQPIVSCPSLTEANNLELRLESTLSELAQYQFQVESTVPCMEVAGIFERYPLLPGVVVMNQGEFLGMISRQRLMEFLLRIQATDFPLSALHNDVRSHNLVLPATTPILVGAHLALRRSPYEQAEPLVIQKDDRQYTLLDVHELNIAHWQIRGIETQVRYERAQLQMIQTERMAHLGRLVDGVAHEILDPVGFIWGNLVHLSDYTQQVMDVLTAYKTYFPQPPGAIADLEAEIELDYLQSDLPKTIASITAGAERLKTLVTSLQNFCHIDDVYPKPASLHECLDSVLLLMKSRINKEVQVIRDYGHLPPVNCYIGQLSQVFTNILTNSVEALLNQAIRQEVAQEVGGKGNNLQWQSLHPKPQITITTQIRPHSANPDPNRPSIRWISVRIADNGPGLSQEQYRQIVDSFSIGKRVAKETSLALSYQIVTARHGGKLLVHPPHLDAIATGTEFEVLLPLA